MKSCYHLSLLGLLTISLTSCSTQKSPSEIANQLDGSVVLISYPDTGGHGTGFFVPGDSDQCSVLTVRHVVADQEVLKRNFQIEKSTKALSRGASIDFRPPCYWVQSL